MDSIALAIIGTVGRKNGGDNMIYAIKLVITSSNLQFQIALSYIIQLFL